MVSRAEIESVVRSILAERKCRAAYPHTGQLRYNRGNPGVYECECGQRYVKDGRGGLADAPAIAGG